MHEMQTIVTDVHCVSLSVTDSPNDPTETRVESKTWLHCVGHSVQPLPNYFGLLFAYVIAVVRDCVYY